MAEEEEEEEVFYEALTSPKELIQLICTIISTISLIFGIIVVISKQYVFSVFKLLVVIQISEILNCFARFLMFLKDREDTNSDNLQNIIVCQAQIVLAEFSDFCTLSVSAYISVILFRMLERKETVKNFIKIFNYIIVFSVTCSVLFWLINMLMNGFYYNENYCGISAGLNLISFILYWVLLIANCVFLWKCISFLNHNSNEICYDEKKNEIQEENGEKIETKTGEEIPEADAEAEADAEEDAYPETSSITTQNLIKDSSVKKMKSFVTRFEIFIIVLLVLWSIFTLRAFFVFFGSKNQRKHSSSYNAFEYFYLIIVNLMGTFYSFCYFFLLTNIGGKFFLNICPCIHVQPKIRASVIRGSVVSRATYYGNGAEKENEFNKRVTQYSMGENGRYSRDSGYSRDSNVQNG